MTLDLRSMARSLVIMHGKDSSAAREDSFYRALVEVYSSGLRRAADVALFGPVGANDLYGMRQDIIANILRELGETGSGENGKAAPSVVCGALLGDVGRAPWTCGKANGHPGPCGAKRGTP